MQTLRTITILGLVLSASLSAWAQKPNYVPFHYQGKTGIAHVDGTEFLSPGSFGDSYFVVDDFKSYIVQDNVFTRREFFFNASSGEGEGVSGRFDWQAGRLAVCNEGYYHFWVDGTSVVYSPEQGATQLKQNYSQIEPNRQAWDNEGNRKMSFVWAVKMDWTYDVLIPDEGFAVVQDLPDFYNYDLIYGPRETGTMELVGFVLGDYESIQRDIGQLYGIPESGEQVYVYDVNFRKLGRTAYRAKDISTLFETDIQLRGGMVPPPEMENQIIVPNGQTIVLNDEFSLVPDGSDRLALVNSKKDDKPVLGSGHFDYRYFSISDNLKALLQIRHGESGSIFYFDFDGTFFPKGIPMIPENRMDWE